MTNTANFWETKIVSAPPMLRWRRPRRRVRRHAAELVESYGEVAFFRAHELAWTVEARETHFEAKFWQAAAREISRELQRQCIIARISVLRVTDGIQSPQLARMQ